MDKLKSYQEIQTSMKGVLSEPIPWETAMVSLIAICKEKLSYVSWVGFYRAYGKTLWAGPYQGNLACLMIPPGKGVCGASFAQKKTLIVEDVDRFPGHIACDSKSRSEIVLPVYRKKNLVGVFDLDSYQLAAFDGTDEKELGTLLSTLESLDERT